MQSHLKRLSESAEFFNFKFSNHQMTELLTKIKNKYANNKNYKIRLTLFKDGFIDYQITEINKPYNIKNINLAPIPVNKNNVYLYHKTSNRNHLPNLSEDNEFIIYNQDGLITEFVNGNIVLLINQQWLTPKMDVGLLNGIMRQQYLQKKLIHEYELKLSDILSAEKVIFINSVRKWIEIDDEVLIKLKQKIIHHIQ